MQNPSTTPADQPATDSVRPPSVYGFSPEAARAAADELGGSPVSFGDFDSPDSQYNGFSPTSPASLASHSDSPLDEGFVPSGSPASQPNSAEITAGILELNAHPDVIKFLAKVKHLNRRVLSSGPQLTTVTFAVKHPATRTLHAENGDVYPLISKCISRPRKELGANKKGCVTGDPGLYVVKNLKNISEFIPDPGKSYVLYKGKRKGPDCFKVAEYLPRGYTYEDSGLPFGAHLNNVVAGLIQFNSDFPNGHGDMKLQHALYNADGKLFFIDDDDKYTGFNYKIATFPARVGEFGTQGPLKADLFGYAASQLYRLRIPDLGFSSTFSKGWVEGYKPIPDFPEHARQDSDRKLIDFIASLKSNSMFTTRPDSEPRMLITLLEQGLFSSPPLTVEKWQALHGFVTADPLK